MRCIRFEFRTESIFLEYPVVAVRRGVTNFRLFEIRPYKLFGYIGPPREVVFVFVDTERGIDVLEQGVLWIKYGYVDGYVADLPAPPLPGATEDGEVVWSRLVARGYHRSGIPYSIVLAQSPALCEECWSRLEEDYDLSYLRAFIALRFMQLPRLKVIDAFKLLSLDSPPPPASFPGRGSLVGEEFRIVEVDNDYLRLVGRGGDEYLAWDFVLGTLDSSEWVLLGEDGLYTAIRVGDRVVVREPYRGEIYDVRGPPYAPFYPIVPVRWVRERLEGVYEWARRRGFDDVFVNEFSFVDPRYFLKWPLVQFPWEYEFVCNFDFYPFISARFVDCGHVCRYLFEDECERLCGKGGKCELCGKGAKCGEIYEKIFCR